MFKLAIYHKNIKHNITEQNKDPTSIKKYKRVPRVTLYKEKK